MSQTLRLGIISASLQFITVTLVMCLVSLSRLREFVLSVMLPSSPDAQLAYLVAPLKGLLFLVALGIALTDTQFAAFTARRIRHESRLMKPADPRHEAERLLALVGFSTLGCAIFTLEQPPDFVIALGHSFSDSTAAAMIWSGIMSLGVAHFGAIAYAAWRAVRASE